MPRTKIGEGNGTPLQYFAWKIPWMEEPGGLHYLITMKCLKKVKALVASIMSDSVQPYRL